MDNIYVMKDSDHKIFLDYAKHRGWYAINTNDCNKTFVAHVKPITFDRYPSVDTMNNWNPSTGKISNRNFQGSEYIQWSEDDDYDGDDDYDHDQGDYDDDDY